MALANEFGNHVLSVTKTTVFPIFTALQDTFGIHHAKLCLFGTGKHVECAHRARNVKRKHNVDTIRRSVFDFHRVLRAGKRHHKANKGSQTESRDNMPKLHTTARNRLLCKCKRRELDRTLTTLLAVNIKRNQQRNKQQQPKGFGILKMKGSNIHFSSKITKNGKLHARIYNLVAVETCFSHSEKTKFSKKPLFYVNF